MDVRTFISENITLAMLNILGFLENLKKMFSLHYNKCDGCNSFKSSKSLYLYCVISRKRVKFKNVVSTLFLHLEFYVERNIININSLYICRCQELKSFNSFVDTLIAVMYN